MSATVEAARSGNLSDGRAARPGAGGPRPPGEALFPTRPIPFLFHYARRRPWGHGSLAVLVIGGAACAVGVQYGMKLLVDAMTGDARDVAAVWSALTLFIGLIAAENLLWRLSGWFGARTIIASGVDIRLDLFEHLSGHAPRFFSEHMTGALGGRMTAVAGASGAVVGTLAWTVAPPVTDLLGAILILLTIDWRMAAALVVFVAIIASALTLHGLYGRHLHQAYAEQAAHVGGELVDTVSNAWLVKAFAARRREQERLAVKFGTEAAAQRKSWFYLEKSRILHDVSLTLMAGSMLTWAIYLWTRGSVTAGDVVVVSALTFRILHGSRDVAMSLAGLVQQFGVIADTLASIAQPQGVPDAPKAKAFIPRAGAISLENVRFGYGAGRPIFDGLTLHIAPGERVGIVGPSGAGKSTFINLVQRSADVEGGRLLIDGQDVREIAQDYLRMGIAVVAQEVSLFHRSVLDNIRYGRPDASAAEVVAASKAAGCDDFIQALPYGYDTFVGERGIRLSGGQRQRLAIARAILKDAPIMILDEATSALDSESEALIQDALSRVVRGRTVLAVAHRLSSVASFDRIIVLVDGRVVEDGPPRELRRTGGVFDAMWRRQAEGFDIDE